MRAQVVPRVVRYWVKFCNERNPRIIVEFGTLNKLLVISRRKVRMTSTHHALYALGDSRATVIRTKSRDLARSHGGNVRQVGSLW
ncbi:hypothetical protein CQW23_08966 [Capsicum baccatum]|uniref:Uncharacterized protein n=1 Tax=Capsicum baccatum TaxID=33114 RepID=A0A2G2XAG8_CAPBA|nr:hypothetical protein CQW23_08966 [Capsicum baccatum]